jgi:thiamine-phosphate pyrophosphorylase
MLRKDRILGGLYAIVDSEVLKRQGMSVETMAGELASAGVRIVQYRDKHGSPQEILAGAAVLKTAMPEAMLVMNDRADLAALAGFGGLHVGQGDLPPEDARRVLGPEGWIGLSTHTEEQVRAAKVGAADYVAVGPVFATGTKADAAAVVGLPGVRRARALTAKPLVAIGGITLANCAAVRAAGADAVAVISGLFVPGRRVRDVARDFLDVLR